MTGPRGCADVRPAWRARGRAIAIVLALMVGAVGVAASVSPAAHARTVTGCASLHIADRAWISRGDVDHPLVGKVYDARAKQFVTAAALGTLRTSRFLLLGEVHDNPDHHSLRAELITGLLRGDRPDCGRRGAVRLEAAVFEHIRADQQPVVDAYVQAKPDPATKLSGAELMRRLDWDHGGWPAAAMFEPLFDAVLAGGLAILAGDPSREAIRAVARGEPGALPPAQRTRLRLDTPLPEPMAAALARELEGSHCGMLPARAIPAMSMAQRFRDAHLADAMRRAVERFGPVVLLTGNGHVRSDRAVPFYLRAAKRRHIATVMFMEVEPGRSEAAAYVPRDPEGRPAVDYIVLTPSAQREDPCQGMRQRTPEGGR